MSAAVRFILGALLLIPFPAKAAKTKVTAKTLAASAALHEKNQDWNSAVKDLSKAIALDGKNPKLFHRRGQDYLNLGNPSKAIDDFYKAVQLKLDFKEAYFDRGRAYEMKGDEKFAKEDYRSACKLGLKKACAPHPAAPKAKEKSPPSQKATRPAPTLNFSACLKSLAGCLETGATYDACVLNAKLCDAKMKAPCCPTACVEQYKKNLSAGDSEAAAYRAVFTAKSGCAQ